MTARKANPAKVLARLADWLLDESVSFRKLDGFRQRLGLDHDSFASAVLGITPAAFADWRR